MVYGRPNEVQIGTICNWNSYGKIKGPTCHFGDMFVLCAECCAMRYVPCLVLCAPCGFAMEIQSTSAESMVDAKQNNYATASIFSNHANK